MLVNIFSFSNTEDEYNGLCVIKEDRAWGGDLFTTEKNLGWSLMGLQMAGTFSSALLSQFSKCGFSGREISVN